MIKFPDSKSFAVNSFGGSPNPASTRIDMGRDIYFMCLDKLKRTLSY